jgi:hypothetical protein
MPVADGLGELLRMIRAAYFDALWRWASPNRPEDAPSLTCQIFLNGRW